MTSVLAVYGALLATALAIWQIAAWAYTNRTRVAIRISVEWLLHSGSRPPEPAAYFVVVNHSHHAIRLIGIGYEAEDRNKGHGWVLPQAFQMYGAPAPPVIIEPRDLFTTWLPRGYLESWFYGRGRIRVRAELATGKQIRTKVLGSGDISGYNSFPDELPAVMRKAAATSELEPSESVAKDGSVETDV